MNAAVKPSLRHGALPDGSATLKMLDWPRSLDVLPKFLSSARMAMLPPVPV